MKKADNITATTESHRLHNMVREVLNSEAEITEVFNSDTEITWENSPTERLGYFSVGDTKYQMKIQKDIEQIDGYDIFMFKFSWWDGFDWQKSFTKKYNTFSVFGGIKKGRSLIFPRSKTGNFLLCRRQ